MVIHQYMSLQMDPLFLALNFHLAQTTIGKVHRYNMKCLLGIFY